MEETEKLFNWVTMQYAGYFKDLHIKTDEGIEENQEQGLYSESDKPELAEFYCDVLKTVVLSMYPRTQKENWYSNKIVNTNPYPRNI